MRHTQLEGGPNEGEEASDLARFDAVLRDFSDGLIGGLNTLVKATVPRKRKYERLTIALDGAGAGYVDTRPREGFEWFIERAYVRAGAGTVEVFIGGNPGVATPEAGVDNFSANKGTPNNSAPYYVRDSQPLGFQVTGGTASTVALITLQVREEPVSLAV